MTSNIVDHADDIADTGCGLRQFGDDAQGLVFVSYRDEKGKLVGHVFNVHKEHGAVQFVDETVFAGNDARFWFDKAIMVHFYEYVYGR